MIVSGSNNVTDSLVFYIDGNNIKSSLRKEQTKNLLVDPNTWSIGTGATLGYSTNGTASEQSRSVSSDPWGNNTVTWKTVPDSANDADGGWNSNSFPVDPLQTYRFSVWARRYTAGTGGTLYFGMNPSIIRNDTGTLQSNPYFNIVAQSSMPLNQWFLIVGHCFTSVYNGTRHPDTGWYTNGEKIADLGLGNVGNADVRWGPSTTSGLHRTYHFYTTNVNSGLEFAYPRVDICNGSELSIKQLLTFGESSVRDLCSNVSISYPEPISFDATDSNSFVFTGASSYVELSETSVLNLQSYTYHLWIKREEPQSASFLQFFQRSTTNRNPGMWFYPNEVNRIHFSINVNGSNVSVNPAGFSLNIWKCLTVTVEFTGTYTNIIAYVDGIQDSTWSGSGAPLLGTGNSFLGKFKFKISKFAIYNRALSSDEVMQIYRSQRLYFT